MVSLLGHWFDLCLFDRCSLTGAPFQPFCLLSGGGFYPIMSSIDGEGLTLPLWLTPPLGPVALLFAFSSVLSCCLLVSWIGML